MKKGFLICIAILILAVFGRIIGFSETEDGKSKEDIVVQEVASPTPTLTPTHVEDLEEVVTEDREELTEENKNELCVEFYYDDIFFGDNLSKGDYVKLHIMVSENGYFTADAIYSDSFNFLMDEWDLYRDFKRCSVLREDEDSYFGVGKVDLYFSNNFQLNPSSYDLGDKLIIYGEVISFYKDEWDGYNDVVIVPVFIEEDV